MRTYGDCCCAVVPQTCVVVLATSCVTFPLSQIVKHKFVFWISQKNLRMLDGQWGNCCQLLTVPQRYVSVKPVSIHFLELFIRFGRKRSHGLFLLLFLLPLALTLPNIHSHSRWLLSLFSLFSSSFLIHLNFDFLMLDILAEKDTGYRKSKNDGNRYNHLNPIL